MLVSPGEEPQQLVNHRFQMDLLGGDEGKAVCQVEAHLVAEDRQRAGAGAVALARAVLAARRRIRSRYWRMRPSLS